MEETKNQTKLWPKNVKERTNLENVGTDGMTILKWFINYQGVKL
jgi:hypothetical protein